MYKVSEVCRLLGTTRKALRGYDEIGLLHPSSRTDAGYWLYDDDAVKTLMSIQILTQLGYSRKRIMELFEPTTLDPSEELDSLIEALNNQKQLIDSKITFIKLLKNIFTLPASTLMSLYKCDSLTTLSQKSFQSRLQEILTTAPDDDDETLDVEEQEIAFFQTMILHLAAIGNLKTKKITDKEVQDCVSEFVLFFKKKFPNEPDENEPDEDEKNWNLAEYVAQVYDFVEHMTHDKEFIEIIGATITSDAMQFILEAMYAYGVSLISEYGFSELLKIGRNITANMKNESIQN